MPSLLGKKFPVPVVKTMFPFYAAGVIVLFGVNAAQNAMMASDEFKNDPRNPNAGKASEKH